MSFYYIVLFASLIISVSVTYKHRDYLHNEGFKLVWAVLFLAILLGIVMAMSIEKPDSGTWILMALGCAGVGAMIGVVITSVLGKAREAEEEVQPQVEPPSVEDRIKEFKDKYK